MTTYRVDVISERNPYKPVHSETITAAGASEAHAAAERILAAHPGTPGPFRPRHYADVFDGDERVCMAWGAK